MSSGFAEFDGYEPAVPSQAVAVDLPRGSGPADLVAPTAEAAEADEAGPADHFDDAGPPQTGNARVDSATALLDDLADQPTKAHADVFDEVHRRLQGALSDLDGD